MSQVRYTSHRNLEAGDEIDTVLNNFSDIFNLDIVVENMHGKKSSHSRSGKNVLYINFFSTPSAKVDIDQDGINEVFGIKLVDQQRFAFKSSGMGTSISYRYYQKDVDDDDDDDEEEKIQIVAEMVKRTLFVLFDLPHNSENAANLMQKILEQYVLQCLVPKSFAKNKADYLEKLKTFNKLWFVEMFKNQLRNDINKYNEKLYTNKCRLIDISKEVIRLNKENKLLDKMANFSDDLISRISDEYQKIISNQKVSSVDINTVNDETVISVYTNMIEIPINNRHRQIGCFRIDIYLDGKNGLIRCRNLTNKIGIYDHPHVYDGECCFGNIEDAIPKLIGKYELADLTKLLIAFLETCYPDGWYYTAENWPVRRGERDD